MKIIPAILLLACLGLIVSIVIIRVHYQISLNPGDMSFCHISDAIDCDAVLSSPYVKLGPFFNAELAFGYYLILIWGLFEAWGAKKPLPAFSYIFIWAVIAAVYNITLNFLSIMKLRAVCPLGLILSVINLAVLILLPLKMKVPFLRLPATLCQKLLLAPKSLLFYGAGTILIFGMGLLFARKLNPQAQFSFGIIPEAYLRTFYALPQKEVPLPKRPVSGNPNAPLTILAFSDLQCPPCRRFEAALKPVLKQYGDRIRVIYLNYPLDSSCNPTVSGTRYPMACIAAKEALCTYQHGKFSEYRDLVFEHRERGRASLSNLIREVGMDLSSFENCLASEKTAGLLKEDIATSTQFDVEGVPSIYINGRRFRDWSNAERFRLVLESELTRTVGH